jgi:arylsulfatase A-like enzyme
VIVSDHGEGLDDHPNVARSTHHGVLVYESQLLVPWILYQPGWQPARREIASEVRLLDVVPTVLDLLGLEVPKDLEGKSLRPLIEGVTESTGLPELKVAETQFRHHDRIAVYSDEWAYIQNRTQLEGVPEIELQRRGEVENGRATDRAAAHPAVVARLRTYLEQWEQRHPKAAPTPAKRSLTDEEREQLKALGYLQE